MSVEALLALPWTQELVSDGKVWFARIVELQGCVAEGDSKERALNNLEVALNSWLVSLLQQGQPIPQPRGFDRKFSGRFSVRVPPRFIVSSSACRTC